MSRWANKCGHKGGGSQVIHSLLHLPYTEIIIAEQFSFATYAWSWAYAAICLLSHFMSPMFSLLFFLIHHLSSMMSRTPDAMCWHPHINAKVNGKTKGGKWFAQGCGLLLSRHSDTLGLHRKEIGSRGNESRLYDVIYYNPSVRRGGVSLITGSNEQLSCVQHDCWLQEP